MAKETTSNAKDTKAKDKKPKKPGKFVGRIKETFGELKKVTWPSFAQVLKQTGIVLAVTAIFLVVLMGFDAVLGQLYKLLVSNLNTAEIGSFALGAVTNSGVSLPLCL